VPKIVDHRERRRSIATAACATVAEVGLERTTLAAVARRCALTTGAIAVTREIERAAASDRLPAAIDTGEEAEALIAQVRGLCIRALVEPANWPAARLAACLARYLDRVVVSADAVSLPGRRSA